MNCIKRILSSRRAVALALVSALLLVIPPPAYAVAANPSVRVGLLYGANALPGVNLENYVGSGYRFGYMSSGSFVEVGRTSGTKISMIKNRDVYVTGTSSYSDSVVTDTLIGSFHDEDGLKASREEAEKRVADLRAAGEKAFVYYEKGKWGVRVNSYIYNAANAASKKTGTTYCISIVVTGTNDIIFQYDSGSLDSSLVVAPDIMGASKPQTWFKGYRYNGLFEYSRREQNNVTVINLVDMQDYLKGVVPYEMSGSWHVEALKAQAVAARTYAVRNMGKHGSGGFDICNTTHCQVYYGCNSATSNSNKAVDDTYGEYVTYNGALCDTVYSASSGGATEDSENVWGSKIAYLRGVFDIYEDLSRVSGGTWTRTTTNAQLTEKLTSKGYANSGVVDFYVSKRTRMGNALEITLVDSGGKKYTFTDVRGFLSGMTATSTASSSRYTINGKQSFVMAINASGEKQETAGDVAWVVGAGGQVSQVSLSGGAALIDAEGVISAPQTKQAQVTAGTYVIDGRGNGHNVGMSQWGAYAMANWGFGYQDILKFYYTGVTITKGT